MRINQKLNLVIPVERETGMAYVHAMPIGREVFDRFFMVIAKTFSVIYGEGLGATAGPRVAALTMRRVAADLKEAAEVEQGLFGEMRRLATVIMPETGSAPIPLDEAIQKKTFDADDLSAVENILCFFSVASRMHRPEELTPILGLVGRLWGAQTTFLNSTAYAASLPTSTAGESTGEKERASSATSSNGSQPKASVHGVVRVTSPLSRPNSSASAIS